MNAAVRAGELRSVRAAIGRSGTIDTDHVVQW